MTFRTRRGRHWLAACVLILMVAGLAAPAAAPAQTDDDGAGDGSVTATTRAPVSNLVTRLADGRWNYPLERLGFGPTVTLAGQVAQFEFFVGIPDGMSPQTFESSLYLSPDVTDGFVEFRDADGRVLASVVVGEDLAERQLPGRGISIPIAGATVRDNGMNITVVSRLRSVDDICQSAFVGAHLDFNDSAITYAGSLAAPDSVGAFFPPVLNSVNLVVPTSPSVSEVDAAVRIAAAILARYQGLDVDFVVTTGGPASGPGAATTPFDRTVLIGEGDSGLAVSGGALPTLTVGGGDEGLGQQAELIASSLAPLSIAEAVTVAGIESPDDFDRRRVTFDELGFRNLQVTGVGQLGLPITITQFDLGGPVERLHFELQGAHTPTDGGIQATLEVRVNDVLVHTETLTTSGTFDAAFDVDGALLRRDTRVDINVSHTPAGGECRLGVHPFVIQVDPGSFIDITPGQSLPPGFTRFPQVLRPDFVMAVDGDALAVESAVELLALLQPLAGQPLRPRVVSLSEAAGADGNAVIVGGPAAVEGLDLPLEPDAFRVVGPEGEEVLRLDVNRDFAVLEGFSDGGRDVLVLTYRNDAGLMKDLLQGLDADRLGWFALTGDTYLRPSGDTPVELRLRGAELTAKAITVPSSSLWDDYGVYVIAVLAAMAIGFLIWAYPRVVRPAPSA